VLRRISLRVIVVAGTQRPYKTNSKISQRIQEDLKKLSNVRFIYVIKHKDWVSPIVCVFKKIGKL